ncbi:MAG: prephenate dehydratase domain-containing protein [SAR324 cluster bacterium]|nr:prephenate dehydratase domain-containing protein [SAR324 cluster bacterium]
MPYSHIPNVFTLGPAGTFSDQAAKQVCSNSEAIYYTKNFNEAIVRVAETPNSVAVVPIENSVAGTVTQIQDALVTEELIILDEFPMRIRYALLSNAPLQQVTQFFAHEQAYGQTLHYTARHLCSADHIYTRSNTDSATQFFSTKEQLTPQAAIVPINLVEEHQDFVVAQDIQDYPNNTTRFVVVRKREDKEQLDFRKRKTSLFIEFETDRAGLLYEMLSIFNAYRINLCRLESRPSKRIPWSYVFFVDLYNSKESQKCLSDLEQAGFRAKILGCYDSLLPI